jgi:hypothetical protein
MNDIAPHSFEHAPDEQPDQPSAAAVSTPDTGFRPVPVAARADGWTPERQRQFIEALADCGIVREAAARVGMSEQGAYQLRRRPDAAGFNQAWNAAVHLGVDRLHSTAFERAISGTVKRRYYNGKLVGEETVFDNRLLIYLIGRLDKNRNYDVRRVLGDWHGMLGAFEEGLTEPLGDPDSLGHPPVWRSPKGHWLTRFAPPEGFEGAERGRFGDHDYCRTLTDAERDAVEAHAVRVAAKAGTQRDRYFARLQLSKPEV